MRLYKRDMRLYHLCTADAGLNVTSWTLHSAFSPTLSETSNPLIGTSAIPNSM